MKRNFCVIVDPAFEIEDNPDVMESVNLESIGDASDQDYFPEQFSEKTAKPKKKGLFRRKKKFGPEGTGIHEIVKVCNTKF